MAKIIKFPDHNDKDINDLLKSLLEKTLSDIMIFITKDKYGVISISVSRSGEEVSRLKNNKHGKTEDLFSILLMLSKAIYKVQKDHDDTKG